MSLLIVNNLQHSFGADTLFSGVSFRLEWRQKLGLVGRNGTGKTTIMRILTGQLDSERGSVTFTQGIEAGYLKQEEVVGHTGTVLEEAEAAFAHVRQMELRLRECEHEMADAADHPEKLAAVMEEYGLLHDRFEAMGGYDNLRDIPAVLKRLGFSEADMNKPCARLSGGEKTRLGLARLLLSGPDILLLDEPTNHLDVEAIEWLEEFLRDFGGALILISHDRTFLDRVTTSIGDLERGKLTIYPGNFSAFARQKEANLMRQAEMYEREQREIARLTEFFEKWKNTPSKKSQAVQRMRWAEKIKEHGLTMQRDSAAAERVQGPGKKMHAGLKAGSRSGEEVIVFDRVGKSYGSRTLFENFTGLIQRGDRVGIVGPNGAGKSTLIKILLGRETPTDGMIRLGASVSVGYFAQDTSDLDLDASVLENLLNVADMQPTQARTHLGAFLFSGEDVFRPARLLSGGEKNKLVLAQLTYLKPNLLVLDEPTNHLDMESRDALTRILVNYGGTLLLVSHDRYLLEQVTNRTIEVNSGRATLLDMGYKEYRDWRRKTPVGAPVQAVVHEAAGNPKLKELLAQQPGPAAGAPVLTAHQLSKERQKAKASTVSAEQKVASLETRLQEIENKLANPGPADNVVALSHEHMGVQQALTEALSLWEKAAAYAESLG